MSITSFLDDVLGQHDEKSKGNLAYHCPFCRHYKKKLEIQPEVGVWACWVCEAKGKTIYSLLKKIGVEKIIWERFNQLPINKNIKAVVPEQSIQVELPKEYRPLYQKSNSLFYKKAFNYVINRRRLTELDLFKYQIGYAETGRYSGMIIIPNYNNDGELNFFSTRSYMNDERKFINTSHSKNVVGFELQLNTQMPLILTEGALDAITVRINACPNYGKTLNTETKKFIIANEIPEIFIGFDFDALNNSIKYFKYLYHFGIDVKLVNIPPDKDFNSLGYDESWSLINQAEALSIEKMFELEFKMKLNANR